MIFEHTMMFRLTTPQEKIDEILDAAADLAGEIDNIAIEKKRMKIRGVKRQLVWWVYFTADLTEQQMEELRDHLWEDHDDIISTLTVPIGNVIQAEA